MEERIKELERLLTEKESVISDLESRLRKSYNVDRIVTNQELETLKQKISRSLKLQYADVEDMENCEVSEDTLTFYKITVKQIFKALKRNGISF